MAGGRRPTCSPDTNPSPPVPPSPVFKARLEAVEASASNPYIYYNMQLQAIIKSGTSQVAEAMGGSLLWEGQACACSLGIHWVSSPPGTDAAAMPLDMKKFVTHASCHDSLELQEQESYLIMGRTSDLWRVKSEYVGASCALGTQPGPPPLLQPSPWCQNLCCICQ